MPIVKDTIARNMAKFGSPVLAKESIYDWADPWAVNHILGVNAATSEIDESKNCSWKAPAKPELEEVFVTTSGGTYSDVDTQKMIQMRHFSCACGKYKDVTIRYAGEHSEFLIALMNDDEN